MMAYKHWLNLNYYKKGFEAACFLNDSIQQDLKLLMYNKRQKQNSKNRKGKNCPRNHDLPSSQDKEVITTKLYNFQYE